VKVGRVLILDMGDNARLSDELLTFLKNREVLTLAQASLGMNTLTHNEIWRRTGDLGLVGEQENECVGNGSHSWIAAGAEPDAHQFYVTIVFNG
jgi:hypothetical protein